MLFDGSRVRLGSVWAVPPASSFTRKGTVQLRPLEDFVKKTSVPVVEPPHPEYARYTTPSEPMAMDDWPPWYPGAWSTRTIAPKYGAALVRYLHSACPTTPAGKHGGGAPRDAGGSGPTRSRDRPRGI